MASLKELEDKALEISKSPDKLKELLEEALTLLSNEKSESYRVGGGVLLPCEGEFLVVGDIHGDFDTLVKLLDTGGATSLLEEGGYLVFLGDYVDRGPMQVESMVIALLFKLKYPEQVVTLRGNHEPPPDLKPFPHDFPDVLISRYGKEGVKLYDAFAKLFQLLPYVAIAKGSLLLLHGGPPTAFPESGDYKEYLSLNAETPNPLVLEEVLWNDPDEYVDDWAPSPRGAGRLFGRKVTERALRITSTRIIVRGHEPATRGFKFNHNSKVLTLFSRLGPPYDNETAAYLRVDTGDDDWHEKIKSYVKLI